MSEHKANEEAQRNGTNLQRLSALEQENRALLDRVNRLEEVSDRNMTAAVNAIQMLEAQQEVLRRVVQDVTSSSVRLVNLGSVEVNGEKTNHVNGFPIDWNGYLKAYIEELAKKEAEAEAAGAVVENLVASPDQEVIIFGGGA